MSEAICNTRETELLQSVKEWVGGFIFNMINSDFSIYTLCDAPFEGGKTSSALFSKGDHFMGPKVITFSSQAGEYLKLHSLKSTLIFEEVYGFSVYPYIGIADMELEQFRNEEYLMASLNELFSVKIIADAIITAVNNDGRIPKLDINLKQAQFNLFRIVVKLINHSNNAYWRVGWSLGDSALDKELYYPTDRYTICQIDKGIHLAKNGLMGHTYTIGGVTSTRLPGMLKRIQLDNPLHSILDQRCVAILWDVPCLHDLLAAKTRREVYSASYRCLSTLKGYNGEECDGYKNEYLCKDFKQLVGLIKPIVN